MYKSSAGPLALAWPEWSTLDPAAAALALLSAAMLLRFKAGIFTTLAVCGVLGMTVKTAGWG